MISLLLAALVAQTPSADANAEAPLFVDGDTCFLTESIPIQLNPRSKIETPLDEGASIKIIHVEDFRTRIESEDLVGMVLTEQLRESCSSQSKRSCTLLGPLQVAGTGPKRGRFFRAKSGMRVEELRELSSGKLLVRVGNNEVEVDRREFKKQCAQKTPAAETLDPLLQIVGALPKGTNVIFLPVAHDGRANEKKLIQNEIELAQKLRAQIPNLFVPENRELAWDDRFYREAEFFDEARNFGKKLGVGYIIVGFIRDGHKGSQVLSLGLYETSTSIRRKALRAQITPLPGDQWSDAMSQKFAKTLKLLNE